MWQCMCVCGGDMINDGDVKNAAVFVCVCVTCAMCVMCRMQQYVCVICAMCDVQNAAVFVCVLDRNCAWGVCMRDRCGRVQPYP